MYSRHGENEETPPYKNHKIIRVMRKPDLCICENKSADELRTSDLCLCFRDIYCGLGNFCVTFISRFFHFRIIREFLNSQASIRVVGHFRGLKIGALCVSCERQINVMHRIAAHAVCQLKLEILFVNHWTASESIIRYSITLN